MGTSSRMAAPMHGDSVKPPRNPMMQMVQGFADGGLIGGAVDAIKNRQNALSAIDSASAPAPSPTPAAPAKPSMGSEADSYAAQAASIEAEQQAAAKTRMAAAKPKSFLSKLGFSEGGKIEGKGTPTSDSIPAEVADTGQQIQVSTDERIISAAQDAFLQKLARDLGFPSLEAMLEAGTGRPVGPTIKEGKPAAEYGASEPDLKNVRNTPTPAAAVGTSTAKPNNPLEGTAFVNAVGGGIDAIEGAAQYGLGALAVPFTNATDGIKNATAHMLGAKRPNPRGDTEAALEFMKGGVDTLDAAGKEFAIAKNPLIKAAGWTPITPEPAPVQPATAAPAAQAANPATAKAAAPVAAKPAAPSATLPAVAQGTSQPATAAPVAPPARNPLTTMNLAASNDSQARANAVRQTMIDGDGTGPKVTMLENSGLAESQALMDKWGRESAATNAMNAAIANPKSAQAIAAILGATTHNDASRNRDAVELRTKADANTTVRRGQDITAGTASEGHAVTARGQDITAKTAANQLAGNPMDNLVKQTTVDINQNALKKAQQQDKMLEDIGAEQDPTRRRALMDTLLASQGKNPSEHRYLKVEGGEEIAPDGFTKTKRPSGVYDTISGKFIPMDGTAPAAAATQAPPADKRVVGQTYPTPKGPMIWRGNGWEAARK